MDKERREEEGERWEREKRNPTLDGSIPQNPK